MNGIIIQEGGRGSYPNFLIALTESRKYTQLGVLKPQLLPMASLLFVSKNTN